MKGKRESRQREVDMEHLKGIGVIDTGKPKAWPVPPKVLNYLFRSPVALEPVSTASVVRSLTAT